MAKLNEVRARRVPITLNDGVERTMNFTLNALAELEDAYGSVEAAFKAVEANSIKAVRKVLWAGLMHENDKETGQPLSEQAVGNLIDIQYMQELMGTMNEALVNDLPNQDTAKKGPALLEQLPVEERKDIDPNS